MLQQRLDMLASPVYYRQWPSVRWERYRRSGWRNSMAIPSLLRERNGDDGCGMRWIFAVEANEGECIYWWKVYWWTKWMNTCGPWHLWIRIMVYASCYHSRIFLSRNVTIENRNEETIMETILNPQCRGEEGSQSALMTHLQTPSATSNTIFPLYVGLNRCKA